MIHLFSLCSPGRPSHLVVLNYFGQNISQVCSFEVPPWIVCAFLDSLSSNDLLAFLEKSESVLKAHLTSLKGYLFVWLAPLLLFIPCHPLCDFSVNFSLSYSLSLLTFPCCPPFSLLSPNPPCFRLLIVSLPLCPLFSSHPANFPPLSLPASSLLICSGPAGPQRGPEHLRAAQAHQQQSANDRSRRHQLPDVHLRRPGAGAQGPGQRAALRWHVSQLAAQCLRHVCMPSVLWRIMYSASLFSGFVTESLFFASSCAKTVFNQIGWKWQNWCISSLHSCIFNPSSLVSSAHDDYVVHIYTLVCFHCQQPICTSWHANGCCMLPLLDTRHVQIHSAPALNMFAFCKPTWLLV